MLRDERYVKNKYEVVDVGCFNEKKIGRLICNLVDVFNNFHERSQTIAVSSVNEPFSACDGS